MARSRDFLDRFRAGGTPGAAAAPGVPADRDTERGAELAALLALLDDTQEECRRVRVAAGEEAARRRESATRQAGELVRAAHTQAEAEHAQLVATLRGRARDDAGLVVAEAERDVAALRAQVAKRLPQYVSLAVARAREELDALVAARPTGPP